MASSMFGSYFIASEPLLEKQNKNKKIRFTLHAVVGSPFSESKEESQDERTGVNQSGPASA